MKKAFHTAGFTFMEMVIYLAIFSLFLLVLTEIFLSAVNIQLETDAASSLDLDAKYLFSRLLYDLQRADTILLPASPGDNSPTLQFSIAGQDYTYGLNHTKMELTDTISSYQLNSFGVSVSDLNFERIGNLGGKNSIKITFRLEPTVEEVKDSMPETYSITVGLR